MHRVVVCRDEALDVHRVELEVGLGEIPGEETGEERGGEGW